MSEAALRRVEWSGRRLLGATIRFVWMIAMWARFFVLLAADQIDGSGAGSATCRSSPSSSSGWRFFPRCSGGCLDELQTRPQQNKERVTRFFGALLGAE